MTGRQFQPTPQPSMAPQPQSKPSKAWMIVAIIAIIAALGVGGYLAYSIVTSNQKISDLQADADQKQKTIAEYKEATGTDNPQEIKTGQGGESLWSEEINFSDLYKALNATGDGQYFNLTEAKLQISESGKFQIITKMALIDNSIFEGGSVGNTLNFYRKISDAEWHVSLFSAQQNPGCDDISEDEKEAFEGIYECNN